MSIPLLDTFTGRLRLEGTLTTRTGLHIGAGRTGDPLGTDLPVVRNSAGEPYIPGASLKGVLRSAAEALLRGGGEANPKAEERLRTCDIFHRPCVSHPDHESIRQRYAELREEEEKKQKEATPPRWIAEQVWGKSCTACRLFGSLALAGRARFPDLPLVDVPPPLEIRNGVGIDRDKELAVQGVLYDFEAVPPGTAFELTVIIDNPSDAEAGLLLYLFEEMGRGHLAIGGKTSRGLGLVRVEWNRIQETKLAARNPFADLLRSQDLLDLGEEPGDEARNEPAESDLPLPESGKPEDWQTLAEILAGLPSIDKNALAQAAAEQGLKKGELGEKLGLELAGPRQERQAWDRVLEELRASGFLRLENGAYHLASRQPEPESASAPSEPASDPRLDAIKRRFIGAMSKLWEEAFQCSPST